MLGSPSAWLRRQWVIAPPHPERDRLTREARIAPLLAQVLLNRGIQSASDVHSFLAPRFTDLHPPEQLPNAVTAGELLAEAVRAGERIVIYGDYDVDGVTATAILWHVLRLAGARVESYIPSRLEEGYGVNADALRRIAEGGAALVITVDCGVTAVAEARLARELGLRLVVTDHHQPRSELPDVETLVHPTALGDSVNPHLSGAGVALKVAWAASRAICRTARVPDPYRDCLLDAMALAALGLIADVVPLTGENRIICCYGLRRMRCTSNTGLRALIDVSGLTGKAAYDDFDIGFLLAPRLNAVGRMGHARLAVELFTGASPDRASEIARELDSRNRQRQSVERDIVRQAEAMVQEGGFDRESCHGIVLAHREWHPGVIGVAANRLVDRFGRPTVLIALDGETGQGSGRSVRHFPLHEVLASCDAHLLSHGGHAMAAGLRIRADQVDAFTRAFLAEAAQRLAPVDLRPRLELDDEVELNALTAGSVEPLSRMAPFGVGNGRPRLASGPVQLAQAPRRVGAKGQHAQFVVREGNTYRRAVAFHGGGLVDQLAECGAIRLAFEPICSDWRGERRVELKVIDWASA